MYASFELPIKNKVGPSLEIMNRKVGSLGEYRYSKTLKDNSSEWSYKNLYLFLENLKNEAQELRCLIEVFQSKLT